MPRVPLKTRFAAYPDAVAYEKPDGKKAVDHLIWGFWVGDTGERKGRYQKKDRDGVVHRGRYARVKLRGDSHKGLYRWIPEHQIQTERLLEVIFIDVGQGDGCLVVTPNDEHLLIDAGAGDNMYRFLRWRYNRKFPREKHFQAVISHPDQDHYGGFSHLFAEHWVYFDTIYTNGLMERFDKSGLGPKRKFGRRSYLTGLVRTEAELRTFLKKKSNWRKKNKRGISEKQFPAMLKKGLDDKRFKSLRMLGNHDEDGEVWLPGYGGDEDLSIQVLGPLVEGTRKSPRLRWITSKGKTKNGHSVVLRLRYKDVSFLLGGDLNIPSEHLLLSHYTGMKSPPELLEDEEALVEAARRVFEVDLAKSCHHGSSDFTSLFLRAINPVATVISSGDDEPHSHPRADALGAIGLHSRGARPLIFSTELARSWKESIKHPNVVKEEFRASFKEIDAMPEEKPAERRAKARAIKEFYQKLDKELNRSVATYGAISVVSNGRKAIVAQKLERERGKSQKWDIYRLEPEGNGPLRYRSKH